MALVLLALIYFVMGLMGEKRMFQQFLNAEVFLVVLSVWGLGVALYLLKMYLQRQNTYHNRVQDRITRIGTNPLRQEDRHNR